MPMIDFRRRCSKCKGLLGGNDIFKCPHCGFDLLKDGERAAKKLVKRTIEDELERRKIMRRPNPNGPKFAKVFAI